MRLVAVEITPDGNLVTIGGKNGAGKSSVLNSIAMALGGKDLVPAEPIRAGESAARIDLDLGEFTVTRKFWRELNHDPGCASMTPEAVCDCTPTWGETKSSLVVAAKDGAQYRSPQAMLEKLFGALTFDPLAFSHAEPKDQRETLRRLVGLDVSAHDKARQVAFDERARLKKAHAARAAQVAAMPKHSGLPVDETPIAVVSQELQQAEAYRQLAEEAGRAVEKVSVDIQVIDRDIVGENKRIDALKDQLATAIAYCQALEERRSVRGREMDAAKVTADAARAAVPDVAVIQAKLSQVEFTNRKIRENKAQAVADGEVAMLAKQVAAQDKAVKAAEEAKHKALAAVKFPVAGLGLSDDGVTFGGLPFSQASTSEQLRVSVAIGLALNPTLRVLLVRNMNLLDDENLALLTKQAEDADCQLWGEYVTSNPEGVSVFIEDGHVRTVEG